MKPNFEGRGQENYVERQLCVQKRNISSVCRCAIKTLIDKSCFDQIDDASEELINFCAIMEEILNHRLKATFKWRSPLEDQHFWDYVKVACKDVPNNCLRNIERMENIKTSKAKGRAWLRLVLMEKRMPEYISTALKQNGITRDMYVEGAMMRSEEMFEVCDSLLGLNAIDFSLCLKGEELEIGKRPAVDYSPYLKFRQSCEGDLSDENELNALRGYEAIDLDNDSWRAKYYKLESMYKMACEQKGYLEELIRLRENQFSEITEQKDQAMVQLQLVESDANAERLQLQGVVLELQQQLSTLKEEHRSFQKKVESYFRSHRGSSQSHESDWVSITSSELQTLDSSGRVVGDSRSIFSSNSEGSNLQKEQTPSIATLHGSIMSDSSQFSVGDQTAPTREVGHIVSVNDTYEALEQKVLEPPRPQKESSVVANEEPVGDSELNAADQSEVMKHSIDNVNTNADPTDENRVSPDNGFEMIPHESGDAADKLSWDNFPLDSGSGTASEEDLLSGPDVCIPESDLAEEGESEIVPHVEITETAHHELDVVKEEDED